jgi:2-phosphoglycolate phosphatase
MTGVKGMLFDLDGTLLDSAPDLVGSLNHVRQSERLSPLPVHEISRHASKGAVGLLKAGMPATDELTFEEWRQRFLTHYAEHSFRESTLFEGVEALLEALDGQRIPWGIVTNKIESLTFPIVEAAGLAGRIGCVVCGDTLSESKPHPAPVRLACSILGIAPADTIFVGDDVRDIQAGQAAGTRTAAVYYGYGSEELRGALVEDSFSVHHPADLLALIG